jgi:hypothetical protein
MQTLPLEALIGPILRNGAFAGFHRTTGQISSFIANGRKVFSAMTGLKSKMLYLVGPKK